MYIVCKLYRVYRYTSFITTRNMWSRAMAIQKLTEIEFRGESIIFCVYYK